MRQATFLLCGLMSFPIAGCGGKASDTADSSAVPSAEKPLVVFSQANSQDPWRQVFDAEMRAAAAANGGEIAFEMNEAQGNAETQISQVEAFLLKDPKVLLISPHSESLTAVCEKVFDKGIPVILLDRGIESDKYTTRIAGDNTEIGRQAARYIAQKLNGRGTVVVIQGVQAATATNERQQGALDVWAKEFPFIRVVGNQHCDYQRVKAHEWMSAYLQTSPKFDAVYAHNDEMAIGASMALKEKNIGGKIVVGVDACQQEVIDKIKSGELTATFLYPHPAKKGMEVAMQLLRGEKNIPKRINLDTMLVDITNADQFLADNPNLAN